MRLLIDEDTAVQLIEPLRHVLLGHEVAHISDLSWKGKKDLRVLPDAKGCRIPRMSPPEHDNGRDQGRQLVRSVIKNFNYPGRAVVLRRYASCVSGQRYRQLTGLPAA